MFDPPQSEAPQKRSLLSSLGLTCVLLGACFLLFPYSYNLIGMLFSTAGLMLAVVDRRQKNNPQLTHLFPQ